jgi:putative ABC transport system permease protein
MLIWTTLKLALKSLVANPMRSILTMLGIIIGVMAVIAMLALGVGVQNQVMSSINAMGTNLLVVRPGQSGSRGVSTGTRQTLTLEDAVAMRDDAALATHLAQVAPVVSGSAQIKFLNRNTRCRLNGTTNTYLPIRNYKIASGRMFSDAEVETQARVAVLGPTTATTLFDTSDPLKEVIKVGGVNFKVIGVLEAKGDQGFFSSDDQVIIPLSTAMKQLLGVDYLGEADVQVKDGEDLEAVQEQLTQLLRKRHRLQPEAENDFSIINQASIISTANDNLLFFRVLMGGIAGISLLVGGIGIMNIMLVSVTERTREIGIRKAIGAKERSILLQFLIEAITISGLGGLLGVAAGVGMARLVEILTAIYAPRPMPTVVDGWSVVMAMVVAGIVGVFFGLYPAWRAARLDPVVALRYE